MPKLIIRDIQEDDLPAVMEIEKISFTAPWSEQDFLNEMYKKSALSKVAVFEENIIGYLCVNYHLHDSHILNLAVHPDFRREGVATILMAEATRELKKRGCAFMHWKSESQNCVEVDLCFSNPGPKLFKTPGPKNGGRPRRSSETHFSMCKNFKVPNDSPYIFIDV